MSIAYVHLFTGCFIKLNVSKKDFIEEPLGIYEQVFALWYFSPKEVDKDILWKC